ncbi:MAG: hypothetical protein AVDCRST_MAG96-3949 [uncultured Segetibacter sp.]|uniref:Uncharacterized protein n=1 Tax=uncultured Segetibacter sp. TaxID=481133 RepID=A0A6J4U1P0_9BACT|nr:MAG: hypothetical protein AVDCRST_MAG96-3949 [uncultured Segetibacter sp.]
MIRMLKKAINKKIVVKRFTVNFAAKKLLFIKNFII